MLANNKNFGGHDMCPPDYRVFQVTVNALTDFWLSGKLFYS